MPQAAISHGTILAWQIVTVMGILVMLVAMVLWMRAHYVKITRGKLLVQVKPDAGRGYQELCEYTKGVCTVPEKKKRGRKERSRQEAVVSKTACWTIDYPQNYPAFVQAQVDTVVLREGDLIPLTEDSDRPMISATRVANLLSEKDTSETIRRSGQISDPSFGRGHVGGLTWVYVGLVVLIFAVGGLLYIQFTGKVEWIKNIKEGLDAIKGGLGLQ